MSILTMTKDPMLAAVVLDEIAAHNISLVPIFDGKLWSAEVWLKGASVATRQRAVKAISATSTTPAGAFTALIEKLDGQPRQQELEEEFW